eukprot:gene10230-11920_t
MKSSFLSKKSWHVSTMRNREKIWKAEQKDEDERKKIEQLKKERMEEDQIHDLKQMHAQSSGTGKTERLDWMYEGAFGLQQQLIQRSDEAGAESSSTTSEHLLGKRIEENSMDQEMKKLQSIPGALFMNTKASTTDQDVKSKLREDPQSLILRKQKEALDKILHNPVEMKRLEKEMTDEEKARKEVEKNDKDNDPKPLDERNSSFFNKINKDVYGDDVTLDDRMKRNKFYLDSKR